MAKDDPFEKSTPDACKTALPPNLRAPDGSLIKRITSITSSEEAKRRLHLHNLSEILKGTRDHVISTCSNVVGGLRNTRSEACIVHAICACDTVRSKYIAYI